MTQHHSDKSPQQILGDGEKLLQKGKIGLAKKHVVRAALQLEEQGQAPEFYPRLLKLTQNILLAEALEKELIKNPKETKGLLRKCTEELEKKMRIIQQETIYNLKKTEENAN